MENVLIDGSTYILNKKNLANGLDLVADIKDNSIATAFFDSKYRGVLDKLQYGNEGKCQKGRCELELMDEETIIKFIHEMNRVMKDGGHLFLLVNKFHLCQDVLNWFADTNFNLVDMIVWDKGKIGMVWVTEPEEKVST